MLLCLRLLAGLGVCVVDCCLFTGIWGCCLGVLITLIWGCFGLLDVCCCLLVIVGFLQFKINLFIYNTVTVLIRRAGAKGSLVCLDFWRLIVGFVLCFSYVYDCCYLIEVFTVAIAFWLFVFSWFWWLPGFIASCAGLLDCLLGVFYCVRYWFGCACICNCLFVFAGHLVLGVSWCFSTIGVVWCLCCLFCEPLFGVVFGGFCFGWFAVVSS